MQKSLPLIKPKALRLAPDAGTFKDIPPGLGGGPKFQRVGSGLGPVPLPAAASPPLQLLPTKKAASNCGRFCSRNYAQHPITAYYRIAPGPQTMALGAALT